MSDSSGAPLVPELVTVEQAAQHLRMGTLTALDYADLQTKRDAAVAIVLEYLARPSDADWTAEMAGWTAETVPRQVQAAIFLQLGDLYRFRGDDDLAGTPRREHGFLSPGVVALLHRLRDPACA